MRTEVERFSGLALRIQKCRNPIAYIDYTIEDLVQCLDGSRTGLWHSDKNLKPLEHRLLTRVQFLSLEQVSELGKELRSQTSELRFWM